MTITCISDTTDQVHNNNNDDDIKNASTKIYKK